MAKTNFEVNWPPWDQILNTKFIPLMNNRDRYIICYGGRGSSKSDAVAKKLIFRCLTENYFRCLLIRNEYSTIKESSFQTIKDIVHELGLDRMFEFKVSPLEIICANGNRFICRGCDDTTKLKSVKDIGAAWYEEDLITESDFITITTSIRTTKATYLQEIFTVNPQVEGSFQDHWFWKRFFEGHDELSFRSSSPIEIAKGITVNMDYTVHHSVYSDNRWLPQGFAAFLLDMKRTNPYYYGSYTRGIWCNKILGGTFFKMFSLGNNTSVETKYNPALPLWVGMDFNTAPGVSCGLYQVENRVLTMIDEIQLKSPRNTTFDVCREICRRYKGHTAGMFVTGDVSGKSNDTRTEKGSNDYTIILGTLNQFRPSDRVPKLNPPIVPSAGFINCIFQAGANKYNGCEIIIGENCTKMIADLLYQLEDSDGTALKKRVTDKETGATYEQYGHFNDLFRYVCCTVFVNEFNIYQNGGRKSFPNLYGKGTSHNRISNY